MNANQVDLEVVIDDRLSTNAMYITFRGNELRVTVSPHAEAGVLAALRPDLGLAVADALEAQ